MANANGKFNVGGVTLPMPFKIDVWDNQIWALDFVRDSLLSGRRFRALTIIDQWSRECPAIAVDTSLTGVRVTQVLEQLKETRGLPGTLQSDNGPEFTSRVMDQWAYARGVKLQFIEPGKPMQNAFIESFNNRLREEFSTSRSSSRSTTRGASSSGGELRTIARVRTPASVT